MDVTAFTNVEVVVALSGSEEFNKQLRHSRHRRQSIGGTSHAT